MAAPSPAVPTGLVVMGVSGSGKTTVAESLAERLGWPLAEADDFHPEANIDKMSAGVPLTDADRQPWLRAIRDWISAHAANGRDSVVTCSALKRRYRDVLRTAHARVRFVFLRGTPHTVADRLSGRSGHFMPPSLLDSQFDALEPLTTDEDGVAVDIARSPAEVVRTALHDLGLAPGGPTARRP